MLAKRVLIVDDDADIRDLLFSALAEDGYEGVQACDGREALAVVERWRPDVIVLDLMMPGMDGWTFARRLREGPLPSTIPILVLSAAHDLGGKARAVDAAEVVSKPFDLEMLLPKIARMAGASPT